MNGFSSFLRLEFFGNPLWRWTAAVSFVLGGLIAGKIVPLILGRMLKRSHRGTGAATEDLPAALLGRPLFFLIFLGGLTLGLGLLEFGDTLRLWAGF